MILPRSPTFLACAMAATIGGTPCAAQTSPDAVAALDANISAAENSLQAGELQIAESRYRSALAAGWMLIGTLRTADHRLPDARDAFLRAASSVVDGRSATQSAAVIDLQMGNAARAVSLLTRLAGADSNDLVTRRLLARALIAGGKADEAVQELEEASNAHPDDAELKYALASGYLWLNKLDAAERLFDEVVRARKLAATYVLIGRTYRDGGHYDRARRALAAALKMDPKVRRAHYYMGTMAVMVDGVAGLDEAIAEFQQELRVAPDDRLTSLRLGMALVEARREADAVPALQAAVRTRPAPPEGFYYLGRAELALDRVKSAVASFQRALELVTASPSIDAGRVRSIHYQLGVALRKLGAAGEAAAHFAEAEKFSAKSLESERDRLGRYLADDPRDPADVPELVPALDVSSLAGLTIEQRSGAERRVRTALARAYLNLGVMQAQKQRFDRAAQFFEDAAGADPEFPQAQHSLGVAYFNARQYEKAIAPLTRALDADPASVLVRRMLAIAYLNTEAYDRSAALLAGDPQRETDPPLQYAYGLALVRSGRDAEAETIFSRLLADHRASAEVSVVLGHVYAQQGDYDAAVTSLQRALQLRPDVADANSALGRIYLQQGKLTEAETALRAELTHHPGDADARHTLATVLDLQGRDDLALAEARAVVRRKPRFADGRYLLGKILLARGDAGEAATHLEIAARIEPDAANIHYQLARAYEKLARAELADKEFAAYRALKDKQRGKTP